jgi:DNA-binding XRE family transcriptional regulator
LCGDALTAEAVLENTDIVRTTKATAERADTHGRSAPWRNQLRRIVRRVGHEHIALPIGGDAVGRAKAPADRDYAGCGIASGGHLANDVARRLRNVNVVGAVDRDTRRSLEGGTGTKYAELEKKYAVALAIADLAVLHRTRAKITQAQLASRMGTSVSAISRLESGFHVPSMETLRKLAEALGGRVQIDIVGNEVPKTRAR